VRASRCIEAFSMRNFTALAFLIAFFLALIAAALVLWWWF
jgi:hypothetical protein